MIQEAQSERRAVSTTKQNGLTRRDFFAEVVDQLRAALPPELTGFHEKRTQNLLKIYYDNEKVHYEVWLINQPRQTEIGLHFEDGPVSTAAYLAYFDRFIVELKHELGPETELERWTPSWGHLYELEPWQLLSERYAARIAAQLTRYVSILQPLVDAAEIAPEWSAEPTGSGRPWRRFRRGRGGG